MRHLINAFTTKFAILSILSGCTTIVTSEKSSPGAEGIPYCLPAQAITFEYSKDGEVKFSVIDDIPDEQRSYVVRAETFLADYDFEVSHRGVTSSNTEISSNNEGSCLLQSVNLNNQVPEDAMKAFTSAADKTGNALLGQIDQIRLANVKKADDEKTKQEQIQNALRKKQVDINFAKLELAKLKDRRTNGDNSVTNEDIKAAEKKVLETESAYDKAKLEANAGFIPSSTLVVTTAANSQVKPVHTPAFLSVRQSVDKLGPTVELVPMEYSESSKGLSGGQIIYP
ncbi:hypothetical protein A1359_20325 [Methylomonas lenta]|uniref:Uncharacterized protein n=1 Tax=Methylomonas lenta TaxID=980561 RepID=A0A177NS07_9GAMM|nr:hypothetical protein [Methylomonas lenta]OAI20836.1 hypothetical protein A1359_20325 [Methylomonas lenta]